jgi:hypothetical protein
MADVNEPFHALRDVARQITGGKSTTTIGGTPPQMAHAIPGHGKETPMETADRMSGSDDDATTASNPGRQAQSTDHMNQY